MVSYLVDLVSSAFTDARLKSPLIDTRETTPWQRLTDSRLKLPTGALNGLAIASNAHVTAIT